LVARGFKRPDSKIFFQKLILQFSVHSFQFTDYCSQFRIQHSFFYSSLIHHPSSLFFCP
jgi:hypothetical protein